jgi:hypothetical protein
MIAKLEESIVVIKSLPENRSCIGCEQFINGYCETWTTEVPKEAVSDGCQEWEEGIPF